MRQARRQGCVRQVSMAMVGTLLRGAGTLAQFTLILALGTSGI